MLVLLTLIFTLVLMKGNCQKDCEEGGRDLDLCFDRINHLMPEKGLPYTKSKIDNYCISFKSGMNCVHNYTSKCLTPEKQFEVRTKIKSQTAFMDFLCNDSLFQKDYLSHSKCFEKITKDWVGCSDSLSDLAAYQYRNGDIPPHQNLENTCCLREIFYQCVYKISRKKCDKEASLLLRKIMLTLLYSDTPEGQCRNYTFKTCSSSNAFSTLLAIDLLILNLAIVFFSCY
ncbi:UNVERIFIED_CONTAM: hypothetical protein RMT77_003524 [Armadillidium vulgare]